MSKLLFDTRTLDQKIAEAKDLLKDNGYYVVGPFISRTNVKTANDLVRYFYDSLVRNRPQLKTVFSANLKKDRAIASNLIKARVAAGCDKKTACSESCLLIDLLFEYEHFLNLNFPVTSMGILGQGELSWVTERLLQIKEGLSKEVALEEELRYYDHVYIDQENVVDEERLTDARKFMDEVLKDYGENKS